MITDYKEKVIVKIGIYLRKSRADDGVQDLQKHKDYLINICNRNKWLFELYEEIDSSQDIHRKELQRLRKDIELGKIDAVMVNAVDRLSRRARHFLEIIEDYFQAQGMTILFEREVEHNLLDSTTITMLQIKATLSQAEYSFIIARLKEGRKSSANEGIWSGKLVYGYTLDKENRKIIPIKHEINIVRKICNMILEGYTYGGICTELNRLGYRTRKGNNFEVYNIKSIIHSPFIRGHVIVSWGDGHKTVVKNNHESAITDSMYEKMRDILDKRSKQYSYKAVAPKHFLQGILHCSKCGLVMVVQANKESTYVKGVRLYGGYRYYIRKCRSKDCINYGCNVSEVEDIIIRVLKEYSNQVVEKIKALKETNRDDIKKGFLDKVKEIERAISKLDNKEESLLDLLLDDEIDFSKEKYNKSIEKIKLQKAELQAELNSFVFLDIEQETEHAENIIDLIKQYELLEDNDKRRLIQLAFEKIDYARFKKENAPKLDFYPNE